MIGHIVALGGGGFSMEPDNPRLDDFILSLCRRKPARVCFIPTASAESATYITRFYRAFSGRCIPTDLTLFDSSTLPRRPARTLDLPTFVKAQDVFYVGGGNTANLWLCGVHMDSIVCFAVPGKTGCAQRYKRGNVVLVPGRITDSFGGYRGIRDGLVCCAALLPPLRR